MAGAASIWLCTGLRCPDAPDLLPDLPLGLWLSKRTFKRCQILGPAKVLLAGCVSNRNKFFGISPRSFVVVSADDDHMADSIIFRDCEITENEFHNITLIGSKEQIAALKSGMSGEDVDD
jgi:hypothetical protein